MDMATYFVMALAVALLAGLTGGMPIPILRPRRAGSAASDNSDEGTVGAAAKLNHVERNLPSEILDALAEAERLNLLKEAAEASCDQVRGNLPDQPLHPSPFPPATEPVLVVEHRRLLDEIVDTLMQGTQFIALTGMRGAGKTTMAAAIREELLRRSMTVRWIDCAVGSGIPLPVIMSRVLGKPATDVGPEDIEQLFDTMMDRQAGEDRLTLIIDDAEQLLPDAIGYLRLLASVAMERMPQIVFVGNPSFWDIADQAAQAGFSNLITARFELEPVSLEETNTARFEHEVVALLDGGVASQPVHRPELQIARPVVAHTRSPLIPATNTLRWDGIAARKTGLAAVLAGAIGAAAYWWPPLGVDRMWAKGRSASELRSAVESVSPDTTIIVRLPFSALKLQAQSDTPDVESASTPQVTTSVSASEIIEPRVLVAHHIGAARSRTVRTRGATGGYVIPANKGIWPFPLNTTGGANS
jgi:type II secretory pathway predicted ATPase ExeA